MGMGEGKYEIGQVLQDLRTHDVEMPTLGV